MVGSTTSPTASAAPPCCRSAPAAAARVLAPVANRRSPVDPASITVRGRGLQGLLIRIARALNKLWSRRGSVFADRYHDHILKSPREVRNALRYVFGPVSSAGGKKHASEGREVSVPQAIDTFTSAPWFAGFRERITVRGIQAIVRPVTDAHTWLLSEGWLRHGRISVHEVPATAPPAAPRRPRPA